MGSSALMHQYVELLEKDYEASQKFLLENPNITLDNNCVITLLIYIRRVRNKVQRINLLKSNLKYLMYPGEAIFRVYNYLKLLGLNEEAGVVYDYIGVHLNEILANKSLVQIEVFFDTISEFPTETQNYLLSHPELFDECDDFSIFEHILEQSKKNMHLLAIKLENYINNNFLKFIRKIYFSKNYLTANFDFNREVLIQTIYDVFKKTCEYENLEFSDIHQKFGGSANSVFIVGEKVIKLSAKQAVFNLPDTSYAVRPYLRKKIELQGPKTDVKESIAIEVMDRVDLVNHANTPMNKIYELYRNLRKEGIVWVDIREDNIGILVHDNNVTTDPSKISMFSNSAITQIPKGSLVILDNDHRYLEDDVPEEFYGKDWEDKSYFQYFESKYQEELRQEKKR